MMEKKFKIGTLVFDHWRISEEGIETGLGNFFTLDHLDQTIDYKSQLKVISVPRNLRDLLIIQNTMEDAPAYIQSVMSFVMEEVDLMTKLNGNPHVVQYYDHKHDLHENGFGCDILIRTELLQPLDQFVLANPLTRRDILRLGTELCRALEDCHTNQIIHRDIRPSHIYATKSGNFKLGNFAIPCLEASDFPSLVGENHQYYMAPELCKGEHYDHTVDIYSLGLVLYQLLNKNRLAFIPEQKIWITPELKEEAKALRLSGATLPPPYFAKKGKLAKVLARASQYKSAERYQCASHLRQDLEALMPKKDDNIPLHPYVTSFHPQQFGKTSMSARLLTGWFG